MGEGGHPIPRLDCRGASGGWRCTPRTPAPLTTPNGQGSSLQEDGEGGEVRVHRRQEEGAPQGQGDLQLVHPQGAEAGAPRCVGRPARPARAPQRAPRGTPPSSPPCPTSDRRVLGWDGRRRPRSCPLRVLLRVDFSRTEPPTAPPLLAFPPPLTPIPPLPPPLPLLQRRASPRRAWR